MLAVWGIATAIFAWATRRKAKPAPSAHALMGESQMTCSACGKTFWTDLPLQLLCLRCRVAMMGVGGSACHCHRKNCPNCKELPETVDWNA